jgi:hypothetical protein
MSNQNNTTDLEERQQYYVQSYKLIHDRISFVDSQIKGLFEVVNQLQNELENLRQQEKTEFNYGKEE